MSTHNIGFCEDLPKFSLNFHQISSNTHLISSADGFIIFCLILYFQSIPKNAVADSLFSA